MRVRVSKLAAPLLAVLGFDQKCRAEVPPHFFLRPHHAAAPRRIRCAPPDHHRRTANVEKLDAGPKGVVIQFRKKEFSNPAALIKYIGEQGALAKIRPDRGVVFMRYWPTPDKRLAG